MGNSTNAFMKQRATAKLAEEKLNSSQQIVKLKSDLFFKRYDEVLSNYILNVFRRTNEEYDRPHDHRATKVIRGELINLRLDSLNGQADGIKVSSAQQDRNPLYIWFQPDQVKGMILFKIVCGATSKKIRIKLEQVRSDFLVRFIDKFFLHTPIVFQSS